MQGEQQCQRRGESIYCKPKNYLHNSCNQKGKFANCIVLSEYQSIFSSTKFNMLLPAALYLSKVLIHKQGR